MKCALYALRITSDEIANHDPDSETESETVTELAVPSFPSQLATAASPLLAYRVSGVSEVD